MIIDLSQINMKRKKTKDRVLETHTRSRINMKRRKTKNASMASSALAGLLAVVWLAALSAAADVGYRDEGQCPTGCFCADDDREVDCSSRGLTHVPKSLPRRTEQL